ncbi:MAG: MBL fold metallo-hydrolase [Actinomycetota bacterium]
MPASGRQYQRYGGATTCFEVDLQEQNHRLLIDAGTGALSINGEPANGPMHYSILLTHLHWDHTLALPFFAPIYDPRNTIDFYGHPVDGLGIEEAINAVMQPPWFPVTFESCPSTKRFHHLDGSTFNLAGISISYSRLYHPQGVTGYRLERDGAVLAVATDVEHGDQESDRSVRELARGADVLIYDAQYHPDEHEQLHMGWGHSTWQEAVAVARDAGVGRLILTSHDPARSDDGVDMIVAMAREHFPNTEGAAEGMKFEVGS